MQNCTNYVNSAKQKHKNCMKRIAHDGFLQQIIFSKNAKFCKKFVQYERKFSSAGIYTVMNESSTLYRSIKYWERGNPTGHEPLRYADTSLPDLLGRPKLYHAVRASAIQQTNLLYKVNNFFKTIGFQSKFCCIFFFEIVA